jgi:hypothetical protein
LTGLQRTTFQKTPAPASKSLSTQTIVKTGWLPFLGKNNRLKKVKRTIPPKNDIVWTFEKI